MRERNKKMLILCRKRIQCLYLHAYKIRPYKEIHPYQIPTQFHIKTFFVLYPKKIPKLNYISRFNHSASYKVINAVKEIFYYKLQKKTVEQR